MKTPAWLNTPAKQLIAISALILLGKFLIILLIESFHATLLTDAFPEKWVFKFLDPVLLTLIVAPALYVLIFRPMREQKDELDAVRKLIEHSHQEWMAALDVLDDPIFLHDKEFRILRCNKAYQQCAGIPFEDIIGQPYYAIFPKAAAPLACCLRAMKEEEEVQVGEASFRSRAFSVKDEQEAYLYSVHILEDITERKQAEAKVAESELHFHALAQSVNDAIISTNSIGNIVDCNDAAKRLFGYTEAEIIGQPLTMLMPERFRNLHREGLARVVNGGTPHVIGKVVELAGMRKDANEFPLELSLAQWKAADNQFFTAIIRDITERKRAEAAIINEREKFITLFDLIPDAVFIADVVGHILQANHTACERLGYSQEELLQLTLADIDTPEYTAKLSEVNKTLQGRDKLVFEGAHVRKDGVVIPVELSARLVDYDGKSAIIGVARDITVRKQTESLLAEQLDELRRWQEATSGRENRILELKHEINELMGSTGQPPRYPSAESQDQTED